jgi:alpha-1,6-mannosyltransferase
VETFGLAALESLACGTPVVVSASSALPEVVGEAGVAVAGTGEAFAGGVRALMERPEPERRAVARARAERFGWPQAVDGFLRAHGALADSVGIPARRPAVLRPAVPGTARLSTGS